MPENVTVKFQSDGSRSTDNVNVSVKKTSDTDPVHIKVKAASS
jgi:hypothetical protein